MSTVYKSVELAAAIIASDTAEFSALAQAVESTARSFAPSHTGHFRRSIKRRKKITANGVADQVIYSDDPAAAAIEHGHLTPAGDFVPGHHTFAKTAAKYR